MEQLFVKSADGFRAAAPSIVCEAATKYVFKQVNDERPFIKGPESAKEFIKHQAGLDHEQFGVIYLNGDGRLLKVEILGVGDSDTTLVNIRKLCKTALDEAAEGVIVFHNHPSGEATPSKNDIAATIKLKLALKLFNIALLDHYIIGNDKIFSFREEFKGFDD